MRAWFRLNSRRRSNSFHPITATATLRCQATHPRTRASPTDSRNDVEYSIRASINDDIPPSHPLRTIRNPWTGRNIQQTPFSAPLLSRSKSSTSVWQTHFLSPGGWVAHEGHAHPLFSQPVNENSTIVLNNEPANDNQSSSAALWYELTPSLERVTQATDSVPTATDSCLIPIEDLPRIDELLWVSKPVNLLTLPGKSEPEALSNKVLQHLEHMNHPAVSTQPKQSIDSHGQISTFKKQNYDKKKKKNKKHDKPWIPRPCHRLDKDTSGIIVIGLTRDAYKGVSLQFEKRFTRKRYVALVRGLIQKNSGTINLPIGSLPSNVDKDGHSYKTWSTSPEAENPREAITYWEVSHRYKMKRTGADMANDKQNDYTRSIEFEDYTRVILHPKTGRGHQLRLHMAEGLGHAILGDSLHGRGVNTNGRQEEKESYDDDATRSSTCSTSANDISPRLCLHAEYLELWVRDGDNVVWKVKCWNVPPF